MIDLSKYPPLLRAPQLAEILNLHPKTLRRRIREGDTDDIPPPVAERPMRWSREAVARWIEALSLAEAKAKRLRGRPRKLPPFGRLAAATR